jgi:hypothetical protein
LVLVVSEVLWRVFGHGRQVDGCVKMEYYHETRVEFFQPVGFEI